MGQTVHGGYRRLTNGDRITSEVGQALLEELLMSPLASADDRDQAEHVLRTITTRGPFRDLRVVRGDSWDVNDLDVVVDDEDDTVPDDGSTQ